ncbi:MAG TPA: radical SAM protein [Thermoanaerobaculia bacterium]|jgi:radical SAM superfamily enzyme YgiQ (UPF0313 family)|nr:radical SAM protein [Thermoanaerobaculia bacterium]
MEPGSVLFVSPVQPIGGCSPNVHGWDKRPSRVRIAMSFLNHPGLCFLKANLPCEILEYPTQEEFTAALASRPRVLGISFYINETEIALRMAEEARRAGVREVWAGNFGAYSPQVSAAFDRVFTGWSEGRLAEVLEAPAPSGLAHPEMYGAFGTNLFPSMVLSGILFTSRGCPWTCNFCQTPDFYGKASQIPLESIDRVLWTYKRRGVRGINILDENFGTFRSHSREVVDLLHRYGMRWIALTRVDTLLQNFDEWYAKGLFGAHLGIESLNQSSLTGAAKRIDQLDSVRLLSRMSRLNLFVQGFYILGFPEDTVDSIRCDVEVLSQLDLDVVQVQVLTPYPRTEQRSLIEGRYGLLDGNLSKYNSRNLVWNHPNITPAEMRGLQDWANSRLTSSRRALRTLAKFALFHGRRRPGLEGLRLVLGAPGAARDLHREYAPRMASARRWARTGWYPYEEVDRAVSITGGSATPLPVPA